MRENDPGDSQRYEWVDGAFLGAGDLPLVDRDKN